MKPTFEIPSSARQPHWILRVILVAMVGLLLSWVTYEFIFFLNPFEHKATSSWLVSYVIGVLRQHHLHRRFSFPESRASYNTTLSRDILSSATLLFMGTLLNWVLVDRLRLNHRLAWMICTGTVAVLTLVLIKTFVFRSAERPARTKSTDK